MRKTLWSVVETRDGEDVCRVTSYSYRYCVYVWSGFRAAGFVVDIRPATARAERTARP